MKRNKLDEVDDFDEYAKNYRDVHSGNLKISGADSLYFAEYKIKYLRAFEKNTPLKILDIGCGDGAVEAFIQQYFPNWSTTGIDVSEESIKIAESRQLPQATFTHFDGTLIPFDAESFDVIFIANVLHHIKFELHAGFLEEVKRVTKSGGRLYIFEHNPRNPFTRYLVRTCTFDEHAVLLKYGYLKSMLKASGFTAFQLQFILFFPRNRWFSIFHFIEKYLVRIPFGAQYFMAATKK